MSKVHEALRRAELAGTLQTPVKPEPVQPSASRVSAAVDLTSSLQPGTPVYRSAGVAARAIPSMPDVLARVKEVPFQPLADAHMLDASRPSAAPAEEFRSLRTRINHLQSL